jgi:phosphatidate cytidylyltransferase
MTRVLSALVLLPVVIGTIWFLPPEGTLILALVAAVLAFTEYRRIAAALGAAVPAVIGGLAVAMACLVMWNADQRSGDMVLDGAVQSSPGSAATLALLLLTTMIVAGAVAVGRARVTPSSLADASATLFAPVYLGLPLGALAAVRNEDTGGSREALLLLLAVIVVSDSAQYYCGRAFGRRPLSPAISPKKTVEGAIGGVVFGTIAMAVGGSFVFAAGATFTAATPIWILALLGAAISLLGIVGDLFESLLKRSAGIKDSSNLIPGHGGVLDRIDSWLFAAPVYYVFVRFVA